MNQIKEQKYEEARERYKETQKRIMALEGKDKRLFELIDGVNVGNYSLKYSEMLTIVKVYDNNAINSCMHFFRLGFLKGQRAAKKANRKRGGGSE